MNWSSFFGDVGAFATALGVLVVILQLRQSAVQTRTAFEDRFSADYRAIVAQLDTEAMFVDADPANVPMAKCLNAFYRYFDLCNEQILLRESLRVSKKTWDEWAEGMRANMGLPAFTTAWEELIEPRTDTATEDQERLFHEFAAGYGEKPKFSSDPAGERPGLWRRLRLSLDL